MPDNILEHIDARKLGERLQLARKKRGLTQEEAAELIGAARTTMVAIEKGERRIRPAELITLARAYGHSMSDLVSERPEFESFDVQFRAVYKRTPEENQAIEPVVEEWQELCRMYIELEEVMNAPLPRRYPQEYNSEGLPVESLAESIAISERNRLGLGDGPINRLRDILEQEVGLRIFYLKMPSKFSEVYTYDEHLGGCIAINANHPEERQRMSLAHGYLHFLAHRKKPVYHFEGQYERYPEGERLAGAFPMYFLMPTSSVVKHFSAYQANGRFTPADLYTMSHYYGVAVEALVGRLEGLRLLPTGTWERLLARGFKVREVRDQLNLSDERRERSDKLPVYYQHLAIVALDRGIITEGRFAELLGVDRLEARRLAQILRERSSGMGEDAFDFDLTQQQQRA